MPALASCAGEAIVPADEMRDDVNDILDSTENFLKDEQKRSIYDFFSNQYYGGFNELQDQIEDTWKNEQLVNIDFTVNRILESDGIYNVQVRWHKSFLNSKGQPKKSSGVSEVILKPTNNDCCIINITGDRFFL